MKRFLLSLLLFGALRIDAQVVISEFMAENLTSSVVDEDGQNNDWVELQNNGPATVSLNGWYLTDDAGDLRKWRFPVGSPLVELAPGARLTVWCSNKNRKASVNRLHTNFRLAADGEFLALVRPDGVTIEHSYGVQYPPQFPNGTYGIGQTTVTHVLVPEGAAGKAQVATSAADFTTNFNTPANAWATPAYSDSGWQAGESGFGFGNPFTGLLGAGGDVQALMQPVGGTSNASCFIRFPFNVTSLDGIQVVRLKIKYDDAYAYFLNGTFIGKSGFAPSTLAWNSTTTASLDRADVSAASFDLATLISGSGPLVVGSNVLGIQMINSSPTNANALCRPQLEVDIAGTSEVGYLVSPTFGTANASVTTTIGPFIRETTNVVDRPMGGAGSAPLVISTKVTPTLRPLAATAPVVLKYRVNYGTETSVTMADDGAGLAGASGDLIAGDDVYTCKVPTTALGAGHMIRWRIEAKDNGPTPTFAYDPPYPFSATAPPANPPPVNRAADIDQYFGTVAADNISTSQLPILHWFALNPANADGGGESCSFFFQPIPMDNPPPGYVPPPGRFYDNVPVSRHGQSSGGFPQKSHNLSLNKGNRFIWKDGEPDCQGLNLLTTYADKSKIRHVLAWDTWNRSRHLASHFARQVRVQQNAAFKGLYDLVEDANRGFLQRTGLDAESGSLYKVYNRLETAKVAANNSDGAEKKNPDNSDFSDLQTLVTAIAEANPMTNRLRFACDNVDIASTINFLAVHALILNRDFGHKNYYMYRDTNGTQEWAPLPWDQDLSFGHTWTTANNYWDDDIHSQGPLRHGTSNQLFQIVYGSNELNTMFVARLRTLMNQFLVSASETNGPLEQKINELIARIDPNPNNPAGGTDDADLNARQWGFWVDGQGGAKIEFTDPQMAHHTVRAHATRILSVNNTVVTGGPYPGSAPYGNFGDGSSSLPAFLPGRRQYLFNMNPQSGNLPIPPTPPADPTLVIESVVFNPSGGVPAILPPGLDHQSFEYLIIRNPNPYAVDLSDWTLTGEVEMTFRAGTVIPAQGTSTTQATNAAYVNQLIVAKQPRGFRARTASPMSNQYRFVTGPYKGQLSARGGSVFLNRPNDRLNPGAGYTQIASHAYVGAPTQAQQALRITELNFRPAGPTPAESNALPGVSGSDFEFIEIANLGSTALNLANARFDRGVEFVFPNTAASNLAAGDRRLIVSNLAAFRLRYGTDFDPIILGEWSGNLDNAGEEIQLVDSVGEVVLEFDYDGNWFPLPSGLSRSLVVRIPQPSHTDYGVPTTWALSAGTHGSPDSGDSTFSSIYEGWRLDHFSAAELPTASNPDAPAAPLQDPDSDGLNNFAEYAFGRDPRLADHTGTLATGGTLTVGSDTYLTITFRRAKNALDTVYHVESSSDMVSWTPATTFVGAADVTADVEEVTCRANLPISADARFLRVRAVKP